MSTVEKEGEAENVEYRFDVRFDVSWQEELDVSATKKDGGGIYMDSH